MREIVDIRLSEEEASKFLHPGVGKVLSSGWTRQIRVATNDPLVEFIRARYCEHQKKGAFLGNFSVERHYSAKELQSAELFQLKPDILSSEDVGMDFGTVYDETTTCPYCGAGRKLASEFFFDLRKLPKGKDLIRTIAEDEWLVSARLVKLIREHGITGAEFIPVKHARKSTFSLPEWYYMKIVGPSVRVASPTNFGINLFNSDREGTYRCPLGHVLGLNILSELSVARDSWNRNDIAFTQEMVGYRPKDGVIVPAPLLVISPRFWQLLVAEKIKGYRVEVTHLI